jgi:glycosyltransferase involved in cell wall biosynthesis
MKQLISNLSIKQHVLFRRLGPDPEDMALLYNATSLFVFPSLYEGFGLPPLEAMACGSPVIAAKNSSIPEILGDGALFFDGHDAEGLAALMIRVLADEELRRSLVQKGLERARGFSWERCARVTLGAYARSTGRKYINGCSMPPEFDVKPRLTRRTLR